MKPAIRRPPRGRLHRRDGAGAGRGGRVGFVCNGRLQQADRIASPPPGCRRMTLAEPPTSQREQAERSPRRDPRRPSSLAKTYAYLAPDRPGRRRLAGWRRRREQQRLLEVLRRAEQRGMGVELSRSIRRQAALWTLDARSAIAIAWPSAPVVSAWPPRLRRSEGHCVWDLATGRDSPGHCGVDSGRRCGASPIAPTGLDSPPLVRTGPSRSGTRRACAIRRPQPVATSLPWPFSPDGMARLSRGDGRWGVILWDARRPAGSPVPSRAKIARASLSRSPRTALGWPP